MGNGMNKVLPGLYIGNFRDSKDPEQLSEFKITHILAIHDNAKRLHLDKEYLCIVASDSPGQNLTQFFPTCNDFIHIARLNGGNVLIHCLAGVSRSVTVAVAYILAVTESLNWREALNAVRGARNIANPNFGFQRQLHDYESDKLSAERRRMRFRFAAKPSPFQDEDDCRKLIAIYHHACRLEEASINEQTSSPHRRSPFLQKQSRRVQTSSVKDQHPKSNSPQHDSKLLAYSRHRFSANGSASTVSASNCSLRIGSRKDVGLIKAEPVLDGIQRRAGGSCRVAQSPKASPPRLFEEENKNNSSFQLQVTSREGLQSKQECSCDIKPTSVQVVLLEPVVVHSVTMESRLVLPPPSESNKVQTLVTTSPKDDNDDDPPPMSFSRFAMSGAAQLYKSAVRLCLGTGTTMATNGQIVVVATARAVRLVDADQSSRHVVVTQPSLTPITSTSVDCVCPKASPEDDHISSSVSSSSKSESANSLMAVATAPAPAAATTNSTGHLVPDVFVTSAATTASLLDHEVSSRSSPSRKRKCTIV